MDVEGGAGREGADEQQGGEQGREEGAEQGPEEGGQGEEEAAAGQPNPADQEEQHGPEGEEGPGAGTRGDGGPCVGACLCTYHLDREANGDAFWPGLSMFK